MKGGDFSEFLGAGQLIYDPSTTAGNVRDPFPNQQIPTSRFSSVSRNILPFIPDPNQGGTSNNFQFLNEEDGVVKTDRKTMQLPPAGTEIFRVEGEMNRDDARAVISYTYTWDWEIVESN